MEYTVSQLVSLISHIHTSTQDFTNRRLSQISHTNGLVSSHGFILYLLSKTDSMTMKEIAQSINRDKSTTTVLVRKLKEEGLVQEKTSATDSRVKNISLTAKGKKLNSMTGGISRELLEVCYTDFSEEEKNTLLQLLVKMSANVDNSFISNHIDNNLK